MKKYRDFKGIKNPDTGDVFTNPMFEQALYVNGVVKEPDANGVITLAVGGTYVITGRHYGRIVVGAATDAPTDDTFIILDGVEIYANDTNAYGIYYAPTSQSLFVTLARNKVNKIICLYEQAIASNQGACLFSENNMVVQGAGYLTVVNKGGHGVRASELRFSGMPHVWCEASHDGIHGNSKLVIHDGYYYINKANDGFGTGTTGHIEIYDGTFYGYNIAQTMFDSKTAGFTLYDLRCFTDANTVTSGMTLAIDSDDSYFGTGVVKVDGTVVEPVSGTSYNVSGEEGITIEVTGAISTLLVNAKKSTVILNKAYVGSLRYIPTKSNLQVNVSKDTVNIVDLLYSNNNLKIECKSGSCLVCQNSENAYDIKGSEITIHDSKGYLLCGKLQGTDIYIADSADHKEYADEAVYGYLKFNRALCARLTSTENKKSNITIKSDNLRGCVLATEITAATGSVDTTGINLGKSPNVFYKKISGDTFKNIVPPVNDAEYFYPYGVGTFPFTEKMTAYSSDPISSDSDSSDSDSGSSSTDDNTNTGPKPITPDFGDLDI